MEPNENASHRDPNVFYKSLKPASPPVNIVRPPEIRPNDGVGPVQAGGKPAPSPVNIQKPPAK